jgi:hypothetical protein
VTEKHHRHSDVYSMAAAMGLSAPLRRLSLLCSGSHHIRLLLVYSQPAIRCIISYIT